MRRIAEHQIGANQLARVRSLRPRHMNVLRTVVQVRARVGSRRNLEHLPWGVTDDHRVFCPDAPRGSFQK